MQTVRSQQLVNTCWPNILENFRLHSIQKMINQITVNTNFLFDYRILWAIVKVVKMLWKSDEISKNSWKCLKIAKKHIFRQKSCGDIFQTIVDIDLIFFWRSKHIPWAHFEPIVICLTHPTAKTPSHLVNSCLFGHFWWHF